MPTKKYQVLQEIVSVQELATMFAISERQVQRLTAQGTLGLATDAKGKNIPGRYVVGEAVSRYVKHLRASIAESPQQKLYANARMRRMVALAEHEELEMKLRRNELHRADHIAFALTTMFSYIKQRMLAIPSRVSHGLVRATDFKTVYTTINDEIRACLTEISEAKYKELMDTQIREAFARGENLPPQRTAEDHE
jgi:hypothetical protein